jgi:hypothetical protein
MIHTEFGTFNVKEAIDIKISDFLFYRHLFMKSWHSMSILWPEEYQSPELEGKGLGPQGVSQLSLCDLAVIWCILTIHVECGPMQNEECRSFFTLNSDSPK